MGKKEKKSLKGKKEKKEGTPDKGLEPLTLRLKVWCSTDWANRAIHLNMEQTLHYIPHPSTSVATTHFECQQTPVDFSTLHSCLPVRGCCVCSSFIACKSESPERWTLECILSASCGSPSWHWNPGPVGPLKSTHWTYIDTWGSTTVKLIYIIGSQNSLLYDLISVRGKRGISYQPNQLERTFHRAVQWFYRRKDTVRQEISQVTWPTFSAGWSERQHVTGRSAGWLTWSQMS